VTGSPPEERGEAEWADEEMEEKQQGVVDKNRSTTNRRDTNTHNVSSEECKLISH